MSGETPIALMVTVEVEPERIEAFRTALAIDAAGSRTEAGCLSFNLLQHDDNPKKFTFYEVWKDQDAINFHKEQDHYKAWADMRGPLQDNGRYEGGVISQTVVKTRAVDFDAAPSVAMSGEAPIALMVTVEVEPERVAAFRSALAVDAVGSRTEAGCLSFNLLQHDDNPNKFTFYEVWKDQDAIKFHKEQDHYKAWADMRGPLQDNGRYEGGVISQMVVKTRAVDFAAAPPVS
jgi:autoinducer 2-degrading protein